MRKKAPTADRRASPRRVPRVGVAIRLRRPGGDNLALLLVNLSLGGLRVNVSEALAKGETVEVVLHAFGIPEPIRTDAEVIWCKRMRLDPSHCGVGVALARPLTP